MPFVNPYNFIPLREKKKKGVDDYYELLTGRINCRLIAKKPILIPDHEKKIKNPKDKEYDEYPFMSVDGIPMIPGSSIRGPIRSVFEALTDSCVFTNDHYYFSSRTNEIKKAGLLEKRKTESGWTYYLHKANRYADKHNFIEANNKQTGESIEFSSYTAEGKLYVSENLEPNNIHNGYVLKMNRMPTDKGISSYSIFEMKNSSSQPVELDQKYIVAFKENIEKYKKGKAKEKAKIYENKFNELQDGEMIPVWYEEEGGKYFLALSQISRNVYTNKPDDLLPESLKRCNSRKELCSACALFGFVAASGENEDGSMGSRVRFSDAWPTSISSVTLIKESVLLPILSEPRSSSLEFYLRHDDDFYHADTEGVKLSGRKFYWHNHTFNLDQLEGDKKPLQTSYMQPANSGSEFIFTVYFDRITQVQLNQLFTALSLGENTANSNRLHKIGHGKPIGFGSVKIIVDSIYKRSFSEKAYEPEVPIMDEVSLVDLPDALRRAVDFMATGDNKVDYPRLNEGGKIFGWFAENRPLVEEGKARFYSKLPLATNENILLPDNPKDNLVEHKENKKTSIKEGVKITSEDEKENRNEMSGVTQRFNKLKEKARKPKHDYDKQAKTDNQKLLDYYNKNTPLREDATDELKKAYSDAEKKLKDLKLLN